MADVGAFLCGMVVLVIPSTIWVAFDASKRPGLSWDWALGVFFLWIIFFPWYLVERRKYPVAQPEPQLPPAGWYRDPDDGQLQRWWDGGMWSDHKREIPQVTFDAGPPPS